MDEQSITKYVFTFIDKYGPLGLITVYLLYQDYLERKEQRKYLQELKTRLEQHEIKFNLMETKLQHIQNTLNIGGERHA